MALKADVMVVAPHPDDAEIGAGGTIARWTREGKVVIYLVCTNGDKGTSDRNMKPEELARIREEEQLAAARVLGVKEVVFLRYPDQSLEDTPEFRKDIVRVIRTYRPDTVALGNIAPRFYWHRDHRMTYQVTLDAIFPYARDVHSYPDLLEQGLEPHKVREILLWGGDDANYFSDITDTYELKMEALSCHKSQVGDNRRPDLEEGMKQRHRMLAEGTDYELAEAFHRIEMRR